MADPCTYGGVPLWYPDPQILASAEEALNAWSRPEVSQWPKPPRLAMPRALNIGQLFWPWGAARCAVGLFLVDDDALAKIRPQVYGASGMQWNALPFTMNDGTQSISTNLFMTPPRPLDQVPKLNGLYAIQLVDDRYRWWEKAATITVTRNVTTWTQLVQQFATALGVTITQDAVASAYLKPDATLAGFDVDLPPLLDQALASCGQRLVRLLNGQVITQNPRTAKKSQDAQLTAFAKDKGGLYFFTPPKPTDLQGQVPAQVVVVFPVLRGGTFAQIVTLVSLGLPEYAGIVGHPGSKVIRSLAAFGGTNAAELAALATQIAQDYYLWQLGRQVTRFFGTCPYVPEAQNDHVKWTSSAGEISTWVRRARTPDPGSQGSSGTAGSPINDQDWFYIVPGPTGTPALTGVLPFVDFGGLDVQGGLVTSALAPPTVTAITLTTTGATTYTFTVIGTTVTGLTTAPGPLLTTTTGPNSPPSVGSPITVSFAVTPGITNYTIYQPTPTPGVVALVTYDPTTVTVTATTGTGTTITGATITPGATAIINIPIVSAPNQSLALTTGIDTTNQIVTGLVTSSGVLVPQLPTPPAPTTTSTPPAGGTNVSYTVVLQTPAGTFTVASSSLSLTSIQTPSVANPVNLQVSLTNIPAALLVGAVAVLYRPTNTGGLTTGPIQVSPVAPGATVATFTDTGQGLIPGLPTSAPTSNTTGTITGAVVAGLQLATQTAPGSVTVTPLGTTGAASVTYGVTSVDATGESAPTTGNTTTSNATINSTNPNGITWTPSPTNPLSYNIYRTVGGPSQGKIGSVLAGQPLFFKDTGITGGSAAPVADTGTGRILQPGGGAIGSGPTTWTKVTKTFSDFSAAAMTNTLTIATLSNKQLLRSVIAKTSTSFSGGAITAYALDVNDHDGSSGITGYDLKAAVAASNFKEGVVLTQAPEFGQDAGAIQAVASTTGANLNAATQGSVDIWLEIVTFGP